MQSIELRPLSIGEILDRTFALYRGNFVLFAALAALPRLPALAAGLLQVQFTLSPSTGLGIVIATTLATYVCLFAGYLFAQGGAVTAVSEIYVGRTPTILGSLRRVWDDIGSLIGALLLNGIVVGLASILLILPGVYMMCRLFVCVPAAVIEKKTPGDSLSRSMELTKGFAGRSFIILALYFVLAIGFGMLSGLPAFLLLTRVTEGSTIRLILSIQILLNSGLEMLLTPVLLIATSIFYYDLRIRKEAFDLQVMMDPESANIPRPATRSIIPTEQ